MLLEDLLPVQPPLSAVAPPSLLEDPVDYSMPARSSEPHHSLPPPTMQCEPPPVTRLIPENMISSLPGMAGHAMPMAGASHGIPLSQTATGTISYGHQPALNTKSLFCSETESEEGAGILQSTGRARSHNDVLRNTLQENGSTTTSSSFEPCLQLSNYTNGNSSINYGNKNHSAIESNVTHNVGISRPPTRSLPNASATSMNTNERACLMPITIKIPNTKVRLPHKKGGKQSSYKPHGPGDGLLMVATRPQGPHHHLPQQYPIQRRQQQQQQQKQQQQQQQQHPTKQPASTQPNAAVESMTSIQTGQGTFNIISTCEPGSKVPTPPASHLNNASLSMARSSTASVITTDEHQSHTRRAVVTSQSLAQAALTGGGGKARKSRAKGGSGKKRTSFTITQVSAMERRFEQQRYLTTVERQEFAASLGLDDNHVKIWFQNRRSKRKKQGEVSSSTCSVNRPVQGARSIATTQILPSQLSHVGGSAPVSVGAPSSCADQHQPNSFREAGCPLLGAAMGHSQQHTNGVQSSSVANFPTQSTRNYTESMAAGTVASSCYTSYAPMNTSAAAAASAPFANYPHAFPPQIIDFNQSQLVSSAVSSAPMSSLVTSYGVPYPAVTSSAAPANQAGYLYHCNPVGPDQSSAVNLSVYRTQQGMRSTSPFNFSFTPPAGSGCHAENSLPQPLPMPLLSSAQY